MVAQPPPARGTSGAAPVPVRVPVRVLGGARAGSETPGSGSTAVTRPPPQPGLLPALLPGPPRAPPRGARPAGEGRGRPARGPALRLPAPHPPRPDPSLRVRPLLSVTLWPPPRRVRGRGSAARQPAGRRRTEGALLGQRRGLDFTSPPPRGASAYRNSRGPKPCSRHRTETALSRGSPPHPHPFISLPHSPRGAGKGHAKEEPGAARTQAADRRPARGPRSGHCRGRPPPGCLRDSMATQDPRGGGACRGGGVAPSIYGLSTRPSVKSLRITALIMQSFGGQ